MLHTPSIPAELRTMAEDAWQDSRTASYRYPRTVAGRDGSPVGRQTCTIAEFGWYLFSLGRSLTTSMGNSLENTMLPHVEYDSTMLQAEFLLLPAADPLT
ncbi:hypothetical protein IF2G_00534 [Cordyceps javanica]|nr:hypothetical protein IF2G_00534 [Cordyceps javanica]